jgi:hypothetical protein
LTLPRPTPSDAAMSAWLSSSTYASHNNARSRVVNRANVRATSSSSAPSRRAGIGISVAADAARDATPSC